MDATKQCTKCLETKSLVDFHNHNSTKDKRHPSCKVCVSAYNKAKAKQQLDEAEEKFGIRAYPRHFKHLYNCTADEYMDRMSRSEVCEACGKEDTTLCYDHDHDTMEFRGVLCHNCNRAFGLLGDTLGGVESLLNYARRHYA